MRLQLTNYTLSFALRQTCLLLLLCLCIPGTRLYGQQKKLHPMMVPTEAPWMGFKHFITKTPWLFHFGGSVIDDDGKPFNKVFDVSNSWNIFPGGRLSVEKECRYNWSIELAASYNQLKTGKTLNNKLIVDNGNLIAIDLHGKKMITRAYRIEPYVFSGLGYTMRSVSDYKNTATLNAGFGFNVWLLDNQLGINVQGCGKFGLRAPVLKTGANYLHHTAGLVYKISGNQKRLKAARAHLKKTYSK